MSDFIEKRPTHASRAPNGIRQSYDAKFKLMLSNYTKKTNNCIAARKFRAVEANMKGWGNKSRS
jgi:hypothetical protein